MTTNGIGSGSIPGLGISTRQEGTSPTGSGAETGETGGHNAEKGAHTGAVAGTQPGPVTQFPGMPWGGSYFPGANYLTPPGYLNPVSGAFGTGPYGAYGPMMPSLPISPLEYQKSQNYQLERKEHTAEKFSPIGAIVGGLLGLGGGALFSLLPAVSFAVAGPIGLAAGALLGAYLLYKGGKKWGGYYAVVDDAKTDGRLNGDLGHEQHYPYQYPFNPYALNMRF